MRIHATYEVYESINDQSALPRLRKYVGEMVGRFMESGKVESGGMFSGVRGGFFVLNVDSAEELLELVGDGHEFVRFEWRPVIDVADLGKFFEEHPPI